MARTRLPRGFTADLRRLRSWPSMEGSPWRQPYLAELTFGEMFRLVNKLVSGHKLRILEVVQSLLRPKGRIICVEYAYDQFDRRSATWFYHIRRVLEQAGWFKSYKKLSGNLVVSVARIKEEWRASGRKDHLNRFKEMCGPLRSLFEEKHLSWEPYIFWDIIMDMRIPSADTEMAFARCLMAMEKAVIVRRAIDSVLFCFSGENAQHFGV